VPDRNAGLQSLTDLAAYAGPKATIRTHGQSLIVVSSPFLPTVSSISATIRRSANSATGPLEGDAVKVTVFDLVNKLVSYSSVYKEGVHDIFGDDGTQFCVWTGKKQVRWVCCAT
jgi:hypothetical protein